MRADWVIPGGATLDLAAADERYADALARVCWLDEERRLRLRLALHELVVNVHRHAYSGGDGAIAITVLASAEGLTTVAADSGSEFATPTHAVPAEEGGYGIRIIEQVFDDVAYQRRPGRNEWTLCAYPYARADA